MVLVTGGIRKVTTGDLTVTTTRIASGSGPGTVWYLGVVPAPKAGPKCPKVTHEKLKRLSTTESRSGRELARRVNWDWT